jgi:acyl dehydratase
MAAPGVILGERLGPFDGCIDEALVARYASATGDPNERVRAATAVPPAAIVTQIWEAQVASRDRLVAAAVRDGATGGVHGEHDIVLHRPVRIGERLHTWVDAFGSRPAGRHSLVVLRYTTLDDRDEPVAEQLWTTMYFGVACDVAGAATPEHEISDAARARPVGAYALHLDDGMPTRYAEASGDWSAHHFDLEAARASGFDRLFLHGLCSLAIAAQGVVASQAGGEPERVRRLAVRFASPAFVGEELSVQLYEAGPTTIGFEATQSGNLVLSQGLVELR